MRYLCVKFQIILVLPVVPLKFCSPVHMYLWFEHVQTIQSSWNDFITSIPVYYSLLRGVTCEVLPLGFYALSPTGEDIFGTPVVE